MRMAGIDDATIMELVGHLTKAMLDRYTHPPIERKRAALETFDRVLEDGPPPVTASEPPAKEHIASTRAVVNGEDGIENEEFPEENWWTAGGSNSRPPRCERGALPTELAAH